MQSIMECYRVMDMAQNINAKEMDIKARTVYNSIIKNGTGNNFDIMKPEYRELFNYLSLHSQIESEFKESTEKIEETLALL